MIAIARELHIPKVVVPLFPSHFSALGMLLADERHDFIRTFYSDLAGVDFATLLASTTRWWRRRAASLRHAADAQRPQIHLDLRYVGQEFTLQVPVSVEQIEAATTAASAPPSTRSTSTATPTIRPTSRSRWSTSGWR